MEGLAYFALAVLLSAPVGYLFAAWRSRRRARSEERLLQAQRDFRFQREALEAKFVQIARERIDAVHWLWEDAQFEDGVTFARHRYTRQLTAYIAVTVERIRPNLKDALMDAGANFRCATIVFHFDGERWVTRGIAVLNLSPYETVHLYHRELEVIRTGPSLLEEDSPSLFEMPPA